MPGSTLLLALTGWMDGGLVSTGTVKHFMQGRDLQKVAQIASGGFYIDNFPGSMEISALFRPHAKYEGGLLKSYDVMQNLFLADPSAGMAFFTGREPNLDWQGFGEAIFEVVEQLGCSRIIFIGSFGGTVPHTRDPRLFASVSTKSLLSLLNTHDLRPTDYDGPASFATYLLDQAPRHKVDMISIAAEIPGYLQGINPLSIEMVSRRLARLMNLPLDLNALRAASNAWELQVSEAVEKDQNLAATVRKLEEQYDNELIGLPTAEITLSESDDDDDDDDDADDGDNDDSDDELANDERDDDEEER